MHLFQRFASKDGDDEDPDLPIPIIKTTLSTLGALARYFPYHVYGHVVKLQKTEVEGVAVARFHF